MGRLYYFWVLEVFPTKRAAGVGRFRILNKMFVFALVTTGLAAPLPRVVITGGTHGNEYTGVYLLQRLALREAEMRQAYPSIAVETLLANPRAHAENRRFLEDDLNRMFTKEQLSAPSPTSYEQKRAQEIAGMLGPKGTGAAASVCIDLHTTTSNMGCTLIVNTWSPLSIRAAAFVAGEWATESAAAEADGRPPLAPFFVMLADGDTQESSPHVCSVARDGLEIECGPTPQGLVRADVVASMDCAVRLLLRYFDLLHAGKAPTPPETLEVYVDKGKISFLEFEGGVRDGSSLPAGLVARSLQDRDFQPLRTGEPLFEALDGGVVRYDGSSGDVVYPVFINEAAYYYHQSGRGIGLTEKAQWPVPKG